MKVTLHVPGMHNVSNALAAIALADDLGLAADAVAKGLSDFGGADRRFQYKGCVDGVTIIDDYAHHPDGDPRDVNRCQELSAQAAGSLLPAAHLLAHQGIFRGFCRCALPR